MLDMKSNTVDAHTVGAGVMTPSNKPTLNKRPIYLDYQATTPTDPAVVDAMLPYFSEKFGNPHSTGHLYGWETEEAVEMARESVASLIGATHREIIFTSGATESNNIALKGLGRFHKDRRSHIITLETEHKCVLETCKRLEREGYTLTILPVQVNGLIDLAALEAAITEQTLFVSVMAVHNEIGVIQPLSEIGAICRQHGVYFHTDAAQAFGKISLDVNTMNIDLMSISGHKVYGPMGVGALYVRRRPRVRLEPLFDGGGQERGLRSGTLPAPLCVGFGKAAEIAKQEMTAESERLLGLRDRLQQKLQDAIPFMQINGDLENRIPGNLNVTFPGINGDNLVAGIKNVALSSGSACTSASVEPSYVLRALGLSEADAGASFRLGMGRFTTEEEIDQVAAAIISTVHHQGQGA